MPSLPTLGHTLAELLRNLSDEFVQGGNAISHDLSLSKMKALEDHMCMALAMLGRRINPLQSPLYRLPLDLFLEVASHLTEETDLIHATHVSYHLRDALLSCPSLWSHLNFRRETRARVFFGRSKQAPLHVDMVRDTARTVASLAELRRQSNRIATLKLRHWWIQRKFLSEPLPSLRRLEIFFESDDEEWEDEGDTTWAPVWGPAEEPTSWSLPSLTSLLISGPGYTPFDAPNLTCLRFWYGNGLASAERIVSFLVNCPLLEHINILCRETYGPEPNLVVSLPNIRTYTQTGHGTMCSLMVLNALSLPPSCSITLKSWDYPESSAPNDHIHLPFKNPIYLAEIKRVKLGTKRSACGDEVAGTLEVVNAKGTKVCSERRVFALDGDSNHVPNVAHLNFLQHFDGRSVEILGIDGYLPVEVGGVTVEFLGEVLEFGGVRTLILSCGAARPCLSALNEDAGASYDGQRFLRIHTLIVHSGSERDGPHDELLQLLLSIAQKRKVDGFPFRSILLFLRGDPERDWDEVLGRLRECIENLEVMTGDDALDWDVDKYFLDGLEHLQGHQEARWNLWNLWNPWDDA